MDTFDLSPFGSCLTHLLRLQNSTIVYTDLSERILQKHADNWKSSGSNNNPSITSWLNYKVPMGHNESNETSVTVVFKYLIKAACTIFLFIEPRNVHITEKLNIESAGPERTYMWLHTVLSNPNKEDIAIFVDININYTTYAIPEKINYLFTRQTIRMFQVYLDFNRSISLNSKKNIPARWNFICALCSNGILRNISSRSNMSTLDLYKFRESWKDDLFAIANSFQFSRNLNPKCRLANAWAWGKMKNCSMQDTLGTTMFSLFNISVAQKSYYDNDTRSDSKCIGFWRYKQDSLPYYLYRHITFVEQDYTPEHFRSVQYKLIFCERKKENTAIISSWFAAYHLVLWLLMMIFAIVIVIQRAFKKHTKPDMVVDLWEVLCKNVMSVVSVLFGKKSFETTCMFILLQLCMLVLLTAYRNYVFRELIKATEVKPENSLSDLISSEYKILYTGASPIIFLNTSHGVNIIFDGRMRLAQALINHTKNIIMRRISRLQMIWNFYLDSQMA